MVLLLQKHLCWENILKARTKLLPMDCEENIVSSYIYTHTQRELQFCSFATYVLASFKITEGKK